jgi:hypothetical protein
VFKQQFGKQVKQEVHVERFFLAKLQKVRMFGLEKKK